MTTCRTCDTTWYGLTECHCATCHHHFGSIDAFDRHRQGPVDTRHCVDPAVVVRGDGKPVFRAVDRSRPATETRRGTDRQHPTWVVDKPARVFPVAGRESDGLETSLGTSGDPPASSVAQGRPGASVHLRAVADVRDMFQRAFGHGP